MRGGRRGGGGGREERREEGGGVAEDLIVYWIFQSNNLSVAFLSSFVHAVLDFCANSVLPVL